MTWDVLHHKKIHRFFHSVRNHAAFGYRSRISDGVLRYVKRQLFQHSAYREAFVAIRVVEDDVEYYLMDKVDA